VSQPADVVCKAQRAMGACWASAAEDGAAIETADVEVPQEAREVPEPVDALLIRSVAGNAVLTLQEADLQGLTVAGLKPLVAKALQRHSDEVRLLDGPTLLEDASTLSEICAGRQPLELQMLLQSLPEYDPAKPSLEQVPAIRRMLMSDDEETQVSAASILRKVLSVDEAGLNIDHVVGSGMVPRLIELLKGGDCRELQFETAWALTNIAAGTTENVQLLLDLDVVPIFVEKLRSPSEDIQEQVVWALGNIAGDSVPARDVVLGAGALTPMAAMLQGAQGRPSFLRNLVWASLNACRGNPTPPLPLLEPVLLPLADLVKVSDDAEALVDACWALSAICEGSNDHIQAVVDTQVCPRVVALLGQNTGNRQMLIPTLRMMGNILAGDEVQTDAVLDAGGLGQLVPLISHDHQNVRKEALWSISNILAGTPSQIKQVIDGNVMPLVVGELENGSRAIRKEAAWCILNLMQNGVEHFEHIADLGCMGPLLEWLLETDPDNVSTFATTLETVLEKGARRQSEEGLDCNPYAQLLNDINGFERLAGLEAVADAETQAKLLDLRTRYGVD